MNRKDYLLIKSKPKYYLFLCFYFLVYPFCKLLYGRKRNWLVCERGNDAQDNGYVFFKYLVKQHPEIKPVYLIKKESKDCNKVDGLGKVVEFGSIKHLLMCIGYPVKISSHLFGYSPWVQLSLYYRRHKTHDKHVFLQHGIIKNMHEGLCADVCKSLDLFVCGAKTECEYIINEFHYYNHVPQYTGLARYDNLFDFENKNQILFMPTWRAKLTGLKGKEFIESEFCKNWIELCNSKELINKCKEKGLTIKFYLHYSLQRYSNLFKDNEVIKVVLFGQEKVQTLLKESKLLVTDFSSVFFDYAYMQKPVIYFQFDENTFYDEHYTKGYFDYRENGFGPVYLKTKDVINHIVSYIDNGYVVEPLYLSRMQSFFKYRDQHNCDRIFDAIIKQQF